jgi:hypothetical protein
VSALARLRPHDQRRHRRYRAEIPVRLVWKGGHEARTYDVSYGGMFLETAARPPLEQLIRLEVGNPSGGEPWIMHGMVVRLMPSGNRFGRPAGVGIELYGVSREDRDAWQELVDELAALQRRRGA